jgi:hypothetical protein
LGCAAARQLRCDSSTPKGDSKLNLVRKIHGNLVLLVVLIVPAFIFGAPAFFCLASCSTNCFGCASCRVQAVSAVLVVLVVLVVPAVIVVHVPAFFKLFWLCALCCVMAC